MPGPREHVAWGGFLEFVAVLTEPLDIAGEGRRVTGDVNDTVRGCLHDCLQQRLLAAGARWVEDDDIRACNAQGLIL